VFFREWGSEFSGKLAAVGLTQTADTGQIDWVTVVRAGVNANAGYEIWRFNDTAHATAPIFMRIDYGTGGSANTPRMQITVGTGSSGAGVITGTAISVATTCTPPAAATVDTARQSFMCYVAGTTGFFGFCWKIDYTSTDAGFLLARTVDAAGAATVTGGIAAWGGSAGNLTLTQAFRYAATAIAYPSQTAIGQQALCLSPQARSSSTVGADTQAFLCYTVAPQVTPLIGMCGVLDAEISAGSTFTATLVGSSPRTYIGLTGDMGPSSGVSIANNGPKYAMLWE
jgi:hypothetical protein